MSFRYSETSVYPVVLCAVVMHYVWAVAYLVDDSAIRATAFSMLGALLPKSATILSLVAVATLALVSFGVQSRFYGPLLMLPQQFFLIVSAAGALRAVIEGHFADGVVRSREFLLSDQIPAVLMALGHTLAIIMRVL
jgi:hypothetical protein